MFGKRDIDVEITYVPADTGFSAQRIKDVAKKHDIQNRATIAGRKNEPRTEDTDLDENQRGLVDECVAFIGAATRRAGAEIVVRLNQMLALMLSVIDTAGTLASIRRKIAEIKDQFRDELEQAYAERQRKWRDLRSFEEANRLGPHSAVYKEDKAIFFAVLLVLILLEAVFNAFSFEELQDRGLIGGLILAVTVSVANVLMGLGTGFLGWRLMIHARWGHRLLGTVLTALFMGAAFALHLALADLRQAITHDTNAQIDFLVILKPSHWFAYTSIPPFVLFAVGVATFVVAALKGRGGTWGIVAPYPQHDAFDRRFQAAHRALEDAKVNLKNAVQNSFDEELGNLRRQLKADDMQLGKIRELASEAEGVKSTLGDSIKQEIDRLHIWLRMYRTANRAVRTSPAPKYFDTYPDFDEWRSARLDVTQVREAAERAERFMAENRTKVAELEEKIAEEATAAIDAMLTLMSASERRAGAQVMKDDTAPVN